MLFDVLLIFLIYRKCDWIAYEQNPESLRQNDQEKKNGKKLEYMPHSKKGHAITVVRRELMPWERAVIAK